MPNLTQLRHFLALARHRHFGRAADAVHLSQSAFSRSVQALERSIGKQLVERARGGIELSAHGQFVAERAEVILREQQLLTEGLSQVDDSNRGTIRIGVGAYPAEISGVEAATRVVGVDGRLMCHLRLGDFRQITEDLLARRVDLGFCDLSLAREDERVQCIPLARHQLYAYTRPGHPLLEAGRTATADPFDYPLIGVRAPHRVRVTRCTHAHDFDDLTGEVLPALNTASPCVALKLLLASNAVAFATLGMIESLLAEGRVALVPLRVPTLEVDTGFVHLASRSPSPLALRYMEEVRAVDARAGQLNRRLEASFDVAESPPSWERRSARG